MFYYSCSKKWRKPTVI